MTRRNIAASLRHFPSGRVAIAAGNVLACSGLLGFIACSDSALTGPKSAQTLAAAAPAAAATHFHPDVIASSGDTLIQTFVYDPAKGANVNFANRALVTIPAAAVCDPKSSGYGQSTWDKSCTPLKTVMSFTVRAWMVGNNTQAVVTPDVRFVPGKIASLSMAAPRSDPTATPVIQWCTAAMTGCVNESTTDATLSTQYMAASSVASRRIKHFSGYNVTWSHASAGTGQGNN